jgi:hypothetical protein
VVSTCPTPTAASQFTLTTLGARAELHSTLDQIPDAGQLDVEPEG